MQLPGIYIYGAGGHGAVALEAAQAASRVVLGFVDGNPDLRGSRVLGVPVCATTQEELIELARREQAEIFLGIGSNSRRAQIVASLGDALPFATLVHPSAIVSPSAHVGPGSLLLPGSILHARARIGAHCILNTGASVDHDCTLGDFVQVSVGAHLGGGVCVGEGSLLGIGALVRNGISIGAKTIVGVGAAVVGDLPAEVVAWGVPARIQRPSSDRDSFC